jgi:diguanylate cyclase (GGDEF)-like protein
MRQLLGYAPQTVLIAKDDDFQARLRASRLGVLAFYTKPINIDALIAVVDDAVSSPIKRPYRLLVLEDDSDQTSWLREAFSDSGVSLRTIADVNRIAETLVGYKPETVVVDFNDRNIGRTDLIRILRQHDYGADLPLLIFGRGIDVSQQLLALKAGADDILSADGEPALLVQQVTNHCRRYRRLVHRMMYDALTGVLNRDAFIERVDEEIGRAKRAGEHYAMAMIDLYDMHNLREQQGELMADIATKCLAALVRRRLRKTDVVGRFSGGELVAFLPATAIDLAVNVFRDIGQVLRAEPFNFGERSLELDICVGLATGSADQNRTVDELLAAADELLYHAKRKGVGEVVAR